MKKRKHKSKDRPARSLFHRKTVSPAAPPNFSWLLNEATLLSLLAIAVFLLYSDTLQTPFVFDDLRNIKNNPFICLKTLTWEGVLNAGFESVLPRRPVANISFALNYYFHDHRLWGYHVVNILIHAASGIFLCLLIKTIINLPLFHSKSEALRWIPFCTALIWLVHPVQTQSVTYIVQRMNSLAAMFYVFAMLLYAKARLVEDPRKKMILFVGCVLSGLLALGTKEIAATLPFFIFMYEWYFHQDLSISWLKRRILPIAGVLMLLAAIALIYLQGHPLEKIINGYNSRDFTLLQRVLTESRVVIFYIGLLIWPHPSRLNLDHDFALSQSLTDPIITLPALGILAALFGLAVYLAKRQRLISFCILWFLGNLLIESSIIGLEIIFEHRTYLPSMLLILMVVLLIRRMLRSRWLETAALCAAVAIFSVWTYQRNAVWRDETVLWQDCVKKSPQKARPHNNYAVALLRRGNIAEAMDHYREAVRIQPDYDEAHYNLGVALYQQKQLQQAVAHYKEALRINPNLAGAHNNLANVLQEEGKLTAAIEHYSEALRIRPGQPTTHYNMGVALNKLGNKREAIAHFSEALRIMPDSAAAHYQMGILLSGEGRLDEAVSHFSRALNIQPDYPEAHYQLAVILHGQGEYKQALEHYEKALQSKPGYAEAHNNLGATLYELGKIKQAIYHYSEALRIKTDYAEAHNNIGVVFDELGNVKVAMYHYAEALRINPNYAEAHSNLGIALATQGKLEEATRHFSTALRLKPGDAEAHSNLANALASQGRFDEALTHYSEALQLRPADAEIRRNMALMQRKMERPAGAISKKAPNS